MVLILRKLVVGRIGFGVVLSDVIRGYWVGGGIGYMWLRMVDDGVDGVI